MGTAYVMSENPCFENARASASVETVIAPSCPAVCIRPTSTHLCVLICGRRRTPLRTAVSLIRPAFLLTRSMSRRSDGVVMSLKFIRLTKKFLRFSDHIFDREPVIAKHVFGRGRCAEFVDC